MSEPVLGIDLGTSNSVLATVEDGRPLCIPSRAGGWLTPSMVAFHQGRYIAGREARELLDWFPHHVATATKRFIGQRFTPELAAAHSQLPYRLVGGPSGDIRVVLDGQTLPLTLASALVLGELYLDAQRYFGQPVRKAVITVPANFDDGQRKATKEAAQIAGFDLLRIINEPTAAALAFGMARKFSGKVLVFDLGGGTLDVTVLEVTDGVYEVKATGGHPQLGGEDFDNRIIGWLLEQLPKERRPGLEKDLVSMRRLRTAAEQAKRDLTAGDAAKIEIEGLGDRREPTSLNAMLERQTFDELTAPLWNQSLDVCEQVLRDARLTPKDLEAVLMVGGMTRVPRIRELLRDRLGRDPEHGVSPDEIVAVGAAIQASQIGKSTGETLLLDVASQSLGVGFVGKRVRRLIAKNAAIPTRAEQCFLPASAKQTEATIPIYQGEGEFSTDCTRLGEVRLTGLKSGDREDAPILISFDLAIDGTLSVTAKHPHTGEVTTLRIEARTDLSDTEVRKLRAEQIERHTKAAEKEKAVAFEAFRELLKEVERVAATDEVATWGEGERVAVERLVKIGHIALQEGDWQKVASLTRGLPRLVKLKLREREEPLPILNATLESPEGL